LFWFGDCLHCWDYSQSYKPEYRSIYLVIDLTLWTLGLIALGLFRLFFGPSEAGFLVLVLLFIGGLWLQWKLHKMVNPKELP
jgi:MFS-type transporter involved in bile tolerance (Atg22 family)